MYGTPICARDELDHRHGQPALRLRLRPDLALREIEQRDRRRLLAPRGIARRGSRSPSLVRRRSTRTRPSARGSRPRRGFGVRQPFSREPHQEPTVARATCQIRTEPPRHHRRRTCATDDPRSCRHASNLAHRSHSPNTISIAPRIAVVSASMWPAAHEVHRLQMAERGRADLAAVRLVACRRRPDTRRTRPWGFRSRHRLRPRGRGSPRCRA